MFLDTKEAGLVQDLEYVQVVILPIHTDNLGVAR